MRHKGTRRGMGDAGVGHEPCRLARGPRSLQHGGHSVSARVQTQDLQRRRLTRRELRRRAGRIDHQRARRRVQREPHPTAIGERPVVGHTVSILRGRSLARPEFKQPNLLRPHAVADEENQIARPLHLRGPRRLRCLCANRRAGCEAIHEEHGERASNHPSKHLRPAHREGRQRGAIGLATRLLRKRPPALSPARRLTRPSHCPPPSASGSWSTAIPPPAPRSDTAAVDRVGARREAWPPPPHRSPSCLSHSALRAPPAPTSPASRAADARSFPRAQSR